MPPERLVIVMARPNTLSRNEMPPAADVVPPSEPAPITREGDEVVSRSRRIMGLLASRATSARCRPTVKIDEKDYVIQLPFLVVDGDVDKIASAAAGVEKGVNIKTPPAIIDGDVEAPQSAKVEGQNATDMIRDMFANRDSKHTLPA